MQRFLTLTKAMFLIQLRNGSVLFWNFAFPALLMLIYGVIMSKYMDYMMPGVIVLNILSFGLTSSSTLMLEMREKGVLRRLRATPLPAGQLVCAYLLVNILIGLLQSALTLTMGVVLYHVPLTAAGVALGVPMMMAAMLTFLAFGGVISGVATKTGAATATGMTIYFSLLFISDMIYPLTLLPDWLQKAAPYLPSYLAAQLVRSPLLDSTLDPQWTTQLLLLAVYGVAATVIAARLFRWDPKA